MIALSLNMRNALTCFGGLLHAREYGTLSVREKTEQALCAYSSYQKSSALVALLAVCAL
jgi:butyrate kinase